jgi:hypothetical protein
MMRTLGRFLADFVIGDDWRIAAGVVAVLSAGALLVTQSGASDQLIAVGVAAGFVAAAALSLRD